jgi:hypothetical protein
MHTDRYGNTIIIIIIIMRLLQAMHSVAEHPEYELLTKYAYLLRLASGNTEISI